MSLRCCLPRRRLLWEWTCLLGQWCLTASGNMMEQASETYCLVHFSLSIVWTEGTFILISLLMSVCLSKVLATIPSLQQYSIHWEALPGGLFLRAHSVYCILFSLSLKKIEQGCLCAFKELFVSWLTNVVVSAAPSHSLFCHLLLRPHPLCMCLSYPSYQVSISRWQGERAGEGWMPQAQSSSSARPGFTTWETCTSWCWWVLGASCMIHSHWF